MKAHWIVLLVMLVTAQACKKEDQTAAQAKAKINGQWELASYSCGGCMVPYTSYPQGNGNIISFDADGRFLKKLKDSITFDGRYEIVTSKLCSNAGNVALQTNDPSNGDVSFITLEDNLLRLGTPHCYQDGAVYTYKRIQ